MSQIKITRGMKRGNANNFPRVTAKSRAENPKNPKRTSIGMINVPRFWFTPSNVPCQTKKRIMIAKYPSVKKNGRNSCRFCLYAKKTPPSVTIAMAITLIIHQVLSEKGAKRQRIFPPRKLAARRNFEISSSFCLR